jgi:hydroxymethylbilane synthase
MKIRIATRRSPLAATQAEWVAARLRKVAGVEVEFHYLVTRGDRDRTSNLAEVEGPGFFTREIEAALMEGKADVAVHSLKDLPVDDRGLILAAIPAREDVRDAFIASGAHDPSITLETLPERAKVATSSPRRVALVRDLRPDLEFVAIRGNVGTRIEKIDAGLADAILLANAGLRRLGIERPRQLLPVDRFPAAPAQAALGVQARTAEIAEVVKALDDAPTRAAASAERRLLKALGGGCHMALGVTVAVSPEGGWTLHAALEREGRLSRVFLEGPDPDSLADEAARALS